MLHAAPIQSVVMVMYASIPDLRDIAKVANHALMARFNVKVLLLLRFVIQFLIQMVVLNGFLLAIVNQGQFVLVVPVKIVENVEMKEVLLFLVADSMH